jgi:hypothetical protein
MSMRKTLLGAAVLVLALQGCSAEDHPGASSADPPSGGPVVPTATATSGFGGAPKPAPAGFLDGKRQVFFLPRLNETELPDAVLAVTDDGRLQVTDDYTDRALFVPVPRDRGAPERLIKTGALRGGGEPLCLQVRGSGADPLTVVAAACDADEPTQLFTFVASGKDDDGRTTYAVRNRTTFLQWHPLGATGLVAEAVGDAGIATTFSLLDQGAAALPRA